MKKNFDSVHLSSGKPGKPNQKKKSCKASKINKPSRQRYRNERRLYQNKLKRILRSSGPKEAERWSSLYGAEDILYYLKRERQPVLAGTV